MMVMMLKKKSSQVWFNWEVWFGKASNQIWSNSIGEVTNDCLKPRLVTNGTGFQPISILKTKLVDRQNFRPREVWADKWQKTVYSSKS